MLWDIPLAERAACMLLCVAPRKGRPATPEEADRQAVKEVAKEYAPWSLVSGPWAGPFASGVQAQQAKLRKERKLGAAQFPQPLQLSSRSGGNKHY